MQNGYVPKNSYLRPVGQLLPSNHKYYLHSAISYGGRIGLSELLLNIHIAELRLIAGTQGSENLSLKTNYAISKEWNHRLELRLAHSWRLLSQYIHCYIFCMEQEYPVIHDVFPRNAGISIFE